MTATIKLSNVTKTLGGRAVLEDVSFVINSGEVAGVVGANGSGKTTLLRIAAGVLPPDAGSVEATPGLRIGLLPQGFEVPPEATVADLFPLLAPVEAVEERVAVVARRLADEENEAAATRLADEYDALLARLATPPLDLESVRAELGLREVPPQTRVASLSGGELRKLALLHLVASEPEALLLDEPTNHLDTRGIEWVERYIEAFAGPVLVVSHDRALLDACTYEIIELDPGSSGVEVFPGSYSDYADERARREAELWERFERQQREERRLKRVISAIESRSRNIEQRTINFHYRKRAKKVARRAVTLKARMQREAASTEHLDRPAKPVGGFRGQFETSDAGGASRLVSAIDVTLELGGRRLVEDATFDLRRGERVVLMGANGSGKTTLLRAILGQHPIAAGELSVHPATQPGYLPQEEADGGSDADSQTTALDVVRRGAAISEAEAYNFLHRFLLGHHQVGTPVGRLSYGERRRLVLARLVLAGSNLLLLDEPTNHLDIPSREAFEAALNSFEGAALIVTHDRYFIDQFADVVLELADGRLYRVA